MKGKGLTENNFFDPSKPVEIIALLKGLTEETLSHLTAQQKRSLNPYIEDG